MYKICKLLLISLFFCGVLTNFTTNIGFAEITLPKNSLMKAKHVFYDANNESIIAEGDIFIQIGEYSINADKIQYSLKKDILIAEGKVTIIDDNERRIYGQQVVFKDKLKIGIIKEFIAKLDNNIIIVANLARRVSQNEAELESAIFTPCTVKCRNKPIWQINASKTNIDYENKTITYKHVFFEVYGVPIMYLPYFSHPSPGSPAKSGILAPRIKKDSFMLPVYFRIKPNMDITLSPRIAKNYQILETEFRHKISNGEYQVNLSVGNPELKKTNSNQKKKARYYISSQGNFSNRGFNYGFDFNRTSDKAYLANHGGLYNPYLTSKLYANSVNGRNYFASEGFYFQDLRNPNEKESTPLILPVIRTQNIYSVNSDESILLNINSNNIVYSQPNQKQLARSSIKAELETNLYLDNGHLLNFSISDRMDFYWINFLNEHKEKTFYRNIPEISSTWRYPLISPISNKSNVKIEPITKLTIGRKYKPSFTKYALIDSSKNELSENNIFLSNSFSGIDYHDYGTRFSYGMNGSLLSENLYIDSFLGQSINKHNVDEKNNYEYVGNIRFNFFDHFDLFYRFRRSKNFSPITNEVGASFTQDNIKINANYAQLQKVDSYFLEKNVKTKASNASQLLFEAKYQLIEDLWLGFSSRMDLTSSKPKTLIKTMEVTYLYDCVSIGASLTDNFLQDSSRDVRKARSKSFSIGLKVINL